MRSSQRTWPSEWLSSRSPALVCVHARACARARACACVRARARRRARVCVRLVRGIVAPYPASRAFVTCGAPRMQFLVSFVRGNTMAEWLCTQGSQQLRVPRSLVLSALTHRALRRCCRLFRKQRNKAGRPAGSLRSCWISAGTASDPGGTLLAGSGCRVALSQSALGLSAEYSLLPVQLCLTAQCHCAAGESHSLTRRGQCRSLEAHSLTSPSTGCGLSRSESRRRSARTCVCGSSKLAPMLSPAKPVTHAHSGCIRMYHTGREE
jgi:hypothetical protein